jgi:DNA-binding CsgD family transcriptional regulator
LRRYKKYTEISGFGSNSYGQSFHNFCLQNAIILHSFVEYFREEAKSLIADSEKRCTTISSGLTYEIPDPNRQNFVGYDFKKKKKIILSLTYQEAACLQQLAKGKTFKEIAKNLLISPRTVQNYIYNAQIKSGFHSVHDLLETFSNLVCR